MSNNDDMVFRPRFDVTGGDLETTKSRVLSIRKQLDRQGKKTGVYRKYLRAQAIRRRQRAAMVRKPKRMAKMARSGAGAARALGTGARMAFAGPGMIVAVVVIAAAVASRMITGRSFEGMGKEMQEVFFGDLDDEARAAIQTRESLTGNSDLMRMTAKEGKVTAQMRQMFEEIKRIKLDEVRGRKVLERELDVNNIFDMIALKMRQYILIGWKASGLDDVYKKLAAWLAFVSRGVRLIRDATKAATGVVSKIYDILPGRF